MTRLFTLTGSACACVLLCGCSLMVASGGKHTDQIFTANASVETIRKQMGPPANRVAYAQPLPASEIPEIVRLARYEHGLSLETRIGSREDYVFKGREYDERDSVAAWELEKSTLGTADVLMFPFIIDEAFYQKGLSHYYTVWYRPDGTYFAHDELTANPRWASK